MPAALGGPGGRGRGSRLRRSGREYLGATADDDVAVSAAFTAADRGYRGLVLVGDGGMSVRHRRGRTVSEVVLLPGEQALRAPAWVPWDQRIRPVTSAWATCWRPRPTNPAGARLRRFRRSGRQGSGLRVGFGRVRVLSREGRDEAAQRWHDGPFGPDDAVA